MPLGFTVKGPDQRHLSEPAIDPGKIREPVYRQAASHAHLSIWIHKEIAWLDANRDELEAAT